ncbi:MAG: hypothetical protein WAV76_00280 [Bacteroidota bacterium]
MKSRIAVFTVLALSMFVLGGIAQPATYCGFIDCYYDYNFAEPVTYKNELRNFDANDNSFALSLAEFVIQRDASVSSPIGNKLFSRKKNISGVPDGN